MTRATRPSRDPLASCTKRRLTAHSPPITSNLGKCSFIVGLVIAVAGGLGFEQAWFGWVLAVLGLIVGFLNVSDKESQTFLLAAIALIVAANAVGAIPYIGDVVTRVIGNLVLFLGGAVLVVAVKSLFAVARD